MAAETIKINNYEGVVILDPSLSEDQQKDFFRKSKKTIEDFNGSLHHIDIWGSRALANPIKKLNRGTYFHTTFNADSNCIAELERTMKINDKVLRFIHVKLDARTTLEKHLEKFKANLVETKKRYEEREAKFQARKAALGKKIRKPSASKY